MIEDEHPITLFDFPVPYLEIVVVLRADFHLCVTKAVAYDIIHDVQITP